MKKLNLIFFFVLFFLGVVETLATAQYPDRIFYNGEEYMLHSNPMEAYFAKFSDKRPKTGITSTALWRGYVATFEISDNVLFLKDLQIMVQKKESKSFETEWKSVLSEVFPENKKIKIDWFSGLLVLPHGKLVDYVHMGYGSTYENYILLEIDGGDFKRAREFDYKEYEKFKERQYEAFRKTEGYKKLVEGLRKRYNNDDQFIDSFLKNFVINYTSKILVD